MVNCQSFFCDQRSIKKVKYCYLNKIANLISVYLILHQFIGRWKNLDGIYIKVQHTITFMV
jgi:hypothetical protein